MTRLAHPVRKFRYWYLALAMLSAIPLTAQDSSPQATKTAGEAFKNIQVLKDMPASDLMPTMKSFTVALGVKCSYCHVMGAFDKDDIHKKEVARHMIQMAHEINANHFHGHMRVTCWTCHRGAEEPPAHPEEPAKQ